MDYKIFANHAHVSPPQLRANSDIPDLKRVMEICSISKAVCFAPFPRRFAEGGMSGLAVDWLAEKIENEDSLVGFGTLDFDRDDLETQVMHIHSLGFKGIKIHPAAQEVNVFGEQLRRVYDVAQELGLFLSFHTGIHWHRIADYNLLLFDEVAFNYPRLRFSMEHIGGYAFFRDAVAVMANNSRGDIKHVYAGWTSISMDEDGLPGNWSVTDYELRSLVKMVGNETSVFGLDFPFRREDATLRDIERIKNLDIPEEAKSGILGLNLARALDVDL